MSDTVIRVENLGKKYVIGHQPQERYTALRDVLANKAKGLTQLFNPKSKIENPTPEEFWALKDVSFEVKRGDRIGIIGRNGAGKSTLLKILSRITEPTEGRISIKGRVASLLEVGTGFHPELTGRENIYLNGAILGMSKVEIRRKFDEIVEFAEVEKFLDTPVKRYSSGMHVRLAFSVASHLEPEILVVDEVLAVGDTAFQKKCLSKMENVAETEDRTVLFVSHNLSAVQTLCSRGIVLQSGQLIYQGLIDNALQHYISSVKETKHEPLRDRQDRRGNGIFRFVSIEFCNEFGEHIDRASSNAPLKAIITYETSKKINIANVTISLGFKDQLGQLLFNCPTSVQQNLQRTDLSSSGSLECTIPKLPLLEGFYRYNLFSSLNGEVADWISDAGILEVCTPSIFGMDKLQSQIRRGLLIDFYWSIL